MLRDVCPPRWCNVGISRLLKLLNGAATQVFPPHVEDSDVLLKEMTGNGYCYTYGFCVCQRIQLCQETRSNMEFNIPESCVCGHWDRVTL